MVSFDEVAFDDLNAGCDEGLEVDVLALDLLRVVGVVDDACRVVANQIDGAIAAGKARRHRKEVEPLNSGCFFTQP